MQIKRKIKQTEINKSKISWSSLCVSHGELCSPFMFVSLLQFDEEGERQKMYQIKLTANKNKFVYICACAISARERARAHVCVYLYLYCVLMGQMAWNEMAATATTTIVVIPTKYTTIKLEQKKCVYENEKIKMRETRNKYEKENTIKLWAKLNKVKTEPVPMNIEQPMSSYTHLFNGNENGVQ